MSAKLLKTLAKGKDCIVQNIISGEVMVYWPDENNKLKHLSIASGAKIDLLKYATVKQLRSKSSNIMKLAGKSLRILSND